MTETPRSMRAAVYERTGPAGEVISIRSVPRPEPGPGEVRVRVAWSGVNPSDVKSRAGTRTKTPPFPRIVPHSDGSGVIDRVGSGVEPARIGERVWIWNAAWGRADGTAADFVVLPSRQAVRLPHGVNLDVGACLGIPALTAWHAVTVDGGASGRTVLVAGGAGAVGHYAVQMAKLTGAAKVLTTVSSKEKAALARTAGADIAINYREQDVAMACLEATGGDGVDRVIEVDFAVNAAVDFAVLRTGGQIVVYGSGAGEIPVPFVPAIVKMARLVFFIVYNLGDDDRRRAEAALANWLTEGRLTHNIAARLALEQIAAAHELVEGGRTIGNVILEVSGGN